jgi:hypothetical protein
MQVGVLGEFADAAILIEAARALRAKGYRQIDAFTPYPIEGLDDALGISRSFLNWLVFPAGVFGAAFAFFLQALVNAKLYPLDVGGRPPLATPAFIIITFETMVLFSAVAAFVLLFWLCRLPRLSHPLFSVSGFERVTVDRFWLGVNAEDPRFDPERTEYDLLGQGALRIEYAGTARGRT